ncbi:DinB family protein [Streptomonospora wellingtoniae]|uniref:DinB family protein n=1 Tax=Streptomonospora wellingtoniae TaxID=3075544 RepID=A0ABU2KR39_9ACTN|nr:DinB family protein [Streptomonospora sp. DSM 45055]MDT0301744.1 DinB family protein [Streptomonospora sp. DSM 45055]
MRDQPPVSGPDAPDGSAAPQAAGGAAPPADRALREAQRAVLARAAGGERETAEAFLDYLRRVVADKVRGLTEEQARRRLVPSRTTMAGLLVHLTFVERNWFQRVVGGRSAAELDLPLDTAEDTWDVPAEATLASLAADYERECARSRATAARFDLDDVFGQKEAEGLSLRWILLHMIEETARHGGHADILREQTDGRTGDGG